VDEIDRKKVWGLEHEGETNNPDELVIHAIREGEVPGTHVINYDSAVDTITIRHEAKSRAGFALGAVLAAEFTAGKTGFLQMKDLLDIR